MQLVFGISTTLAVGQVAGKAYLLSSRDTKPDLNGTLGGRLDRARANGFEAIVYFAPVALMLALTGSSTASSVAAAWIYVGARAAYWLCYATNLTPWRTIVWFVGWFAVAWMLIVALLAA